eukprot:COSAG01_NODE_1723_length_9381_cov_23.828611_2_plen_177_part_00
MCGVRGAVRELRQAYDVHTVRLCMDEGEGGAASSAASSSAAAAAPASPSQSGAGAAVDTTAGSAVSPWRREWRVRCHPYDSGADLKRELQACFGAEWGLTTAAAARPEEEGAGRRPEAAARRQRGVDRDGLARGWELLPAVMREQPGESEVLCSHFLLCDYGLRNEDVVYAVIGDG